MKDIDKWLKKLLRKGTVVGFEEYHDDNGDKWEMTTIKRTTYYVAYRVNGELFHIEKKGTED